MLMLSVIMLSVTFLIAMLHDKIQNSVTLQNNFKDTQP